MSNSIEKNKLTKEHSAAVHGLAILLMLFHHLYSSAYSYTNVQFMNLDLTMKAAWFGKICVGLYAFTGGYGVYHVFKRKQAEKLGTEFVNVYGAVLKQIFRLYLKLWLVMAVFLLVDICFIHSPFDFSLISILGNMTAINPTYSGIWWYARQYAIMLLMVPVLHLWLSAFSLIATRMKKIIFYLISTSFLLAIAGIMFIYFRDGIRYIQPSFVLVFFMGYIFARFDIYKKIDERISKKANITWALEVICIIAAVIARVLLADGAAWAELDFILVPVFVYGFAGLISYVGPVLKGFVFMGKFSTYMWLVHGFVYAYFLNILCINLKYSSIIYIVMTIITLGIAAVFELVTSLVAAKIRKKK